MPFAVIEPSGCGVYKGKIQLRFSFYLEPTDPFYERHHVYIADISSKEYQKGYKGKVDSEGGAVDQANYDAWEASLPHIWQNNPFHNHFVYVDASVTDEEIKKLRDDWLNGFFGEWAKGKEPTEYWRKNQVKFISGDTSSINIQTCETKVADIKARVTEFEVKK